MDVEQILKSVDSFVDYIIEHRTVIIIVFVLLFVLFVFKPWKLLSSKTRREARQAKKDLLAYADRCVQSKKLADTVLNNPNRSKNKTMPTQAQQTIVEDIEDQICNDFAGFDTDKMKKIIESFIIELLQVKYEGKDDFETIKVYDRILLDIGKRADSKVMKLNIQTVELTNYTKQNNSAILKYHLQLAFAENGKRIYKSYDVECMCQFENIIKCKVCGTELAANNNFCTSCGDQNTMCETLDCMITNVKEL